MMRGLTRAEQIGLLVAVLAVAAAWAIGQGIALPAAHGALGAVEGVVYDDAYPPGHQHLARASDIGDSIWGPHPLYCDPNGPGRYRDPLIARGWEFMSDPPSEKVI